MSLLSLLLRIVLCVSLIANGAGFAQAATRMQLAHAAHAVEVVPPAPAPTAEAPCHEQMDMAAETQRPATSHHASGGHDTDSADPRDCCDGNACRCACVQHAPVVFMPAVTPGVVHLHEAVVLAGATQHLSPLLPHLIRPPIG